MKYHEKLKALVLLVLITAVLAGSVFVYNGGSNRRTIFSHRNQYHQVIQDLFDRKIVDNQLVGHILKEYPPTEVSAHDNFLTLQYFNNNAEQEDCCISYSYYLHIIVRDSRLVKAFATEGLFSELEHIFFDVLSDSAEEEYWESRVKNTVAMNTSTIDSGND